jgi:hypothetical protein
MIGLEKSAPVTKSFTPSRIWRPAGLAGRGCGCYDHRMRQAVYLSLFRVALIAGGILSWQETQAGDSFGAEVNIGSRAILPSSPIPTDETQLVVGRGTDGGSSAISENEGPSLVDARATIVDRVLQLARATLRHRTTSQPPALLWARTFSVSLPLRNVCLQI